MNEKRDTSASYTDGNKSIIFQENATNSSFEESDVASRLYQLESLPSMERHYIKDLIKSMFRLDSDGNSNGTNGNSNEDLLSISYSTDDEGDIAEICTNVDNKLKPHNDGGIHHSPGEGMVAPRSVKEVEESHANLKKENFNLKLRIYFLEERMNTDFNINPDNAVMKNIELKVQVESLRKELTEKQEMLCQAVKTMELDEEDYKKLLAERDKKFFDLEREYQCLHRKYEQDLERSQGDIILPDPDHMYRSFDLETLETKLDEEHDENMRLKSAFDEDIRSRDLRICCLQAEIEEKSAIVTEQHKRNVALDSDIEKRYLDIKRLKDDHGDDLKRIVDLEGSLRDAQQTMDTAETEYEQECMKVNRMKLSLSQRNKRIMELEDIVRRQKTHIGTLEAQVRQPSPPPLTDRAAVQTSSVATSTVAISAKCAAAAISFPALNETPSPSTSPTTVHQQQQSPFNIDTRLDDTNQSSTATNEQTCLDPKTIERDLHESRRHILKLEKDRRRAGEIIHSMLEKRKELGVEIGKLKEKEKEKDRQIDQLKQVIRDINNDKPSGGDISPAKSSAPSSSEIKNESITDEMDICTKYQTLANDLDKQKTILLAIITEKDSQMQRIELDYNIALTDVNIKDERIVDLENQIQQNTTTQSCEKLDIGSEKQSASFWILESEEKDRQIDRLESQLKQSNTDIQTLVNKELWEKNREIEKIQQIMRGKNKELDQLTEEIGLLKAELVKFTTAQIVVAKDPQDDMQQKLRNSIEDRKKLLDQIEIMYVDNEYPKDYLHLKNEYKQLKDEFERSERLRQQTSEICSVLSNRLEELAFFLDSLLKQKCLLGFLGSKKNGKLRQIIDRSLDLSRTLNMNLSQMNADQSLLQLTNISNFFNNATASSEEDVERTDFAEKSRIIGEQARIINVLQHQIETMKNELHSKENNVEKTNQSTNLCSYDESVVNILLDISKMDRSEDAKSPQMILQNLMSDKLNIQQNEQLLNTSTTTTTTTLKYWQENNNSTADESESWSEPDRNVSKERVGLSNGTKLNDASTETNTEDEQQKQLTKSASKRSLNKQLIEENRELKEKMSTNNDLLLQTEQSFCTVSEQLKRELKILDNLRLENELLSKRISDKETQLDMYESIKISNQKQLGDLHNIIDDLHKQQDDLKRNCDITTKELHNTINALEQDKIHAANCTIQAEEEAQKLKMVVQNYEASLKDLYKEKMHLENALRHESELIRKQADEFKGEVKQLQERSEDEVKRITETALLMKQRYESEYVKRAELDKMMSSIKELESLQMVLNTTEEKIQLLEDNEAKLKLTLQDTHQDYREKLIDMRKEMDLSTLKYSEVMLEKTRQMKDKAALELQIKEYADKEVDFKGQVAEFQQALNSMKDVFQAQVANLNSQKSALQLKLTEVETVNEELRNCLGKINSREMAKSSNSAPSTPSKFFSLLIGRQFSYTHRESEHSSTMVVTNESGDDQPAGSVLAPRPNGGNTSPDLGIESDQGRFSSLENNSVNVVCSRPFYSTVELTQRMQHLLLTDELVGGDNDEASNDTSRKGYSNDNCCLNVIAENSQLRNKLLKTRSALEETVSQLKYANDKKRHVEKTICKQIHKTSQVLRKAKANLDSGSETDLRK